MAQKAAHELICKVWENRVPPKAPEPHKPRQAGRAQESPAPAPGKRVSSSLQGKTMMMVMGSSSLWLSQGWWNRTPGLAFLGGCLSSL